MNSRKSVQIDESSLMQKKKQEERQQSMNSRKSVQIDESSLMQKRKQELLQQLISSRKYVQIEESSLMQQRRQEQRQQTVNIEAKQKNHFEEQSSKKKKAAPKCASMSVNEYVNKNSHQLEIEHLEDEVSEEHDIDQEVEEDVNFEYEEDKESNDCTTEGATSKRKRGKTKCRKVHTRSVDDREKIILNKEGEPIGPNQKIVSELSSFLGTIARSADLCPLTYTNWKAVPGKAHIWNFVNQKYDIPDKGQKAVFAIINDSWRHYKCLNKREHFSRYRNMRDRLKNRPQDIPEAHFRELMDYWRLEAIKEISAQNASNIAKQKWRHRVGPISFACIRERLRASKDDSESPTQAEIFIETRKSKKGKKIDEETNNAITKLNDLVENCGQSSLEAFKKVFGDEKPGRVRCYGRTITSTVFKRNKEIAEIEKKHAKEVQLLTDKMHDMEAKHKEMERNFQLLLKTILNQNDSGVDMDALAALLSPCDDNSPPRSSTSVHAPNNLEVKWS